MLDLQPDRPHELERLVDDLVRHLRFVDDVVENRLRVGRVGHGFLAFQHAGHHFDAGKRIFHLVRNRGGHFAQRDEAIAQALALFELFDLRQVLEKQRYAGRSPPLVAHMRQRVPDDLTGRLQSQFGAVGQMAQLEGAVQHPDHIGMFRQHFREMAADGVLRPLELKNTLRFAVDFRDLPVAGNRQHAIAHPSHQAAEETIGFPALALAPCGPCVGPPTRLVGGIGAQ